MKPAAELPSRPAERVVSEAKRVVSEAFRRAERERLTGRAVTRSSSLLVVRTFKLADPADRGQAVAAREGRVDQRGRRGATASSALARQRACVRGKPSADGARGAAAQSALWPAGRIGASHIAAPASSSEASRRARSSGIVVACFEPIPPQHPNPPRVCDVRVSRQRRPRPRCSRPAPS